MFTHTTSIQCSIGTPRYSNQTRKINKRYPNWKGRGKIVINRDDMIPHVEIL